MKKKFVFALVSIMVLSCSQLLISCSENDLVNYVVDASEQRFQKGVSIWQSPYKNLPSFQSNESRLNSLWLYEKQEQVDAPSEKVEAIIDVTELASASSTMQYACVMSSEKNSQAYAFHEDKIEVELPSTSKLQYISKNKLKRLRQKNNLAAQKEKSDLEFAYLDQEINKNKISNASKNMQDKQIIERALHYGNHRSANSRQVKDDLDEMIETSIMITHSLRYMTEDIKKHNCTKFWRADGSPRIYMMLDGYIKKGGIITIDMQEALELFRKETLKIKIQFRDDKEHRDYIFADINDSYACLMNGMMKKKSPQEIEVLLDKCTSVLSSSLSAEHVASMMQLLSITDVNSELSRNEIQMLQKDNFWNRFISCYKNKYSNSENVDNISLDNLGVFRSRAITILWDLEIENPEPYLQALQKIRSSAVTLQSLYSK